MQFLQVMMTPLQALSLYYYRQVSVYPRISPWLALTTHPLANYLTPPLTTINAHIQQAGYTAALQLVRLLQTGQADLITMLPTEMVIRRSCGCTQDG